MNDSTRHFDFIVIGGGSAGYAAARTAAAQGKSVAICDGSEKLGGLCILRGCMPSKTLIYSAEVLHLAKMADSFGLHIPHAKVEPAALYARKDRLVKEFADYRQQQLESDRFTLFRTNARFTGPHAVKLDDGRVLTADKFLIATGSKVQFPDISGLTPDRVLTSDDILSLGDAIPESITVLGGGVIACEMAQYLRRIGVRVTMIQRSSHLLKEQSPAASDCIAKVFRSEDIDVYLDTKLRWVCADGTVHFEHRGRDLTVRSEKILNALGRVPNTRKLNLEAAGISTAPNGRIVVNAYQQTSNPAVYAAGDCCGPHEIVHVAIQQGECAAAHAFGAAATPVSYRDLTLIIFTDPQVARVGLLPDELESRRHELITAEYPFNDHGKSMVMEALHGYVSVTAERSTGRIVAAECVGKDASELIHSMAVAVTLNATAKQLLKVHWYHPTLSEIWSYPLEEIAEAQAPGN